MKKTSLIKVMCSLIVLLSVGFLGAIPENEIVPIAIPFTMKASPDGTVVVGNGGSEGMASYWTEETGVVNLDVGEAFDVSSNYLIAGTAEVETDDGVVSTAGFWNLDGEFTSIGSFPGAVPPDDGEFSTGMAISDDGTTVAGMGWISGWVANALKWTEEAGAINLHPSEENSSRVNALSADGSIAVGWVDDDWMRKPAYWDANNTLHMIADDMHGEALAISPDGLTILGTLEEEAFILRDGVITTFFMDGWGWSTIPTFITSDGLVTGILRNMMMNQQEGFVYTETMGIVLANDYFTSYGVELPEGYTVDAISWVSEDHSTFVGWGGTDVSQGFIIKLVSPAQISGSIGVAAGDDVTLATISSGQISTHPEADGSYVLTVAPGTHTLTVTMPGYYTATSIAIEVDSGETVANIDFILDEITDLATIQGTASIVEGQGNLTQVQISAGQFVTNPNSDGEYQLLVEAGSYTLTASLAGFFTFEEEITMTAGEVLEVDFGFVALDSFNELVINVDGDDLDYANTRVFVNHNSWGDKYFTPTVDGSVALQLRYESDLTISVYAPGFVPASQAGIATNPYEATTVDFVMEKVYNTPRNLSINDAYRLEWDAPYTVNSYFDDFESYPTGSAISLNNPMWLPIGGDAGSIVDPIVALNPNVSDGKFLEVSADNDAIVNVGNLMIPGNSITTGKYEIDFDIMIPAGFAGHYNIIRSLQNLEFSLEVFFRLDGTLQIHHSGDTFQSRTYNHDEWINLRHVVDLTNDAASLHIDGEEVGMWLFTANAFGEGFGENRLDLINFSGDSEPTAEETCLFYVDNFAFSNVEDFGADAYLVYRDDVLLTSSPLSGLFYQDIELDEGSYLYEVTALYDAIESDPATLVVDITDGSSGLPPMNLTATVTGSDVALNWETPLDLSEGTWITKGAEENSDGIGTGGAAFISVSQRYTEAELAMYQGMYINSIKFFPREAGATYTIKIWGGTAGNVELYSQAVTNFVNEAWNEYALNSSIAIPASGPIFIGYDADTPTGFPAGCDAGPAVPGGDLIKLDNQPAWDSIASMGLNFNWNIQAFVSPEGGDRVVTDFVPLVKKSVTNRPTAQLVRGNLDPITTTNFRFDRAVTGYKVYRDAAEIAEVGATVLTYLDTDLDNGTYEYHVTAMYGEAESLNSNSVTVTISNFDPEHVLIADSFETYPDFVLEFGDWTLVDADFSPTYGFTGVSFTNSEAPMAYIVFNPSTTIPALEDPGFAAVDGSKYLASFAAVQAPNNDWLISQPMTLGDEGFVNFFAKSATAQYGLERFNVLVSTGSTNPNDFTSISGPTYVEAPTAWTEYSYSLDAYANQTVRVAVQCVSDDSFVFMLDDFKVISAGGTDNDDASAPAVKTALHTNYPNPFNPETTISYSVEKAGNVTIEVYNMLGQKVKTLVNDTQTVGNHTVVWNGTDNNGKSVSSGVYFYRMKNGTYSKTNKMILMK